MAQFQPAIKWSGSKRSQCEDIIATFPNEISHYIEPFCGGCSVLRALIESDKHEVKHYVISDSNEHLILLWQKILNSPNELCDEYERMWNEMKSFETQYEKQNYYNKVRLHFNEHCIHPCIDEFLFLNRTCFNGLIRYNNKGEFNSPFHLNRDGMNPDTLRKIIMEWNKILSSVNITFTCQDYHNSNCIDSDDFIYCDPPYAHTIGMYDGHFDKNEFFEWLSKQDCGWALSYDGVSGKDVHILSNMPKIYDKQYLIKSGNSSFKRIKQTDKEAMVYESLYVKEKNR